MTQEIIVIIIGIIVVIYISKHIYRIIRPKKKQGPSYCQGCAFKCTQEGKADKTKKN